MKNIILFDSDARKQLLPLTYTRPICELRVGILTIREKWERLLSGSVSFITQEYLSEKYPIHISNDNYVINGAVLPTPELVELIENMDFNDALLKNGELIAARLDVGQFEDLMSDTEIDELAGAELENVDIQRIVYPWDLFMLNDAAIRSDYAMLTKGRKSQPISETNQVLGTEVFLEPGAKVECAILNSTTGPIYVGKNAEIMEGSVVRGALALCDNATLKLSSKIYGATTIGPHSKVGGEVSNSVITGYSNKAHDGFLGNSVLGEWCNLGADTNTSNLKNTYDEVKLWDYTKDSFVRTGLQFLGLIMGDYSKSGINAMFNTGTVVGVSANVFGAGYPRNFIPSYSWGGTSLQTFQLNKAYIAAEKAMERRNIPLTEIDKTILRHIFEYSSRYRTWDTNQ